MKEELRIYLESLINDIPNYVYECLLSFFCLGLVILLGIKRKILWRDAAALLLIAYILFIYCLTVFCCVAKDVREYDYIPF